MVRTVSPAVVKKVLDNTEAYARRVRAEVPGHLTAAVVAEAGRIYMNILGGENGDTISPDNSNSGGVQAAAGEAAGDPVQQWGLGPALEVVQGLPAPRITTTTLLRQWWKPPALAR